MIDEARLKDPSVVIALWKVARAADNLRGGRECWCEAVDTPKTGVLHSEACDNMTNALLDLQMHIREWE